MFHRQGDAVLLLAASPIPFAQFREEFLSLYRPGETCARLTRVHLVATCERLDSLGVASTADLSTDLVTRFIASAPHWSAHTLKSNLLRLQALCSYAEARRVLAVSPFRIRPVAKWVGRLPAPAGRRHATVDEVRRVLAVMRADVEHKRGWAQWRARRLYALTATVAFTGLRAGEAQCLWVADIDLAGRVIVLVPHGPRLPREGDPAPRFKTEDSAQPVGLPAALVPILEEWLAHRLDRPAGFHLPPADEIPWLFPGSRRISAWTQGPGPSKPVARLKAVAKRAGVEGFTFQLLRRSFATRAEAVGVPQALITRQCRHSDVETTRRWYQQRDVGALRDALEGFDW